MSPAVFCSGRLMVTGDDICGSAGAGAETLEFADMFPRLLNGPGLLLSGGPDAGAAGFLEKSISKTGLPGRPVVFLKGSWAQVISACFSAFSRSYVRGVRWDC